MLLTAMATEASLKSWERTGVLMNQNTVCSENREWYLPAAERRNIPFFGLGFFFSLYSVETPPKKHIMHFLESDCVISCFPGS